MRCAVCGREGPDGEYCSFCGARQPAPDLPHADDGRRRSHAYAARPSESIYQPSIVSTFFPHLGPRRTLQLRWLLLVSATIIVLVGLSRLVPLAVILAALLMPVVYLLYFYEEQLYEDEPLVVLGATFLLGALLGLGMSLAVYRLVLSQLHVGFGPGVGYLLLTGVALPLLGQVLMLVGPLVLYFTRPRFNEVLDGLAFGVASGLGFAATSSIVNAWLLILGPFLQPGGGGSWALLTIRVALLVPLVDAATTGLICAALWTRRDRDPATHVQSRGAFTSLPIALLIAALGQVVPALASAYLGGPILPLVWYAATLAVLIPLVRRELHIGLLEKAGVRHPGGTPRCPHCGHLVGDVAFCPNCGLALQATGKRTRRTLAHQESQAHESEPQAHEPEPREQQRDRQEEPPDA
ncbi:MAG: PrsW family glutamic-type intramembrane protease [Ktedonobacterales bacterium]